MAPVHRPEWRLDGRLKRRESIDHCAQRMADALLAKLRKKRLSRFTLPQRQSGDLLGVAWWKMLGPVLVVAVYRVVENDVVVSALTIAEP